MDLKGSGSAGLCGTCVHAKTVATRRGPVYVLCRKAERDPLYERYPRLPVTRCEGHEPRLGCRPAASDDEPPRGR